MKLFLTLALAITTAVSGMAADITEVKTVYLLPMSRGLDQFVAQRLTAQGVLQVVTDPTKADVLMTDRIGANFEESLSELYGTAKKSDKAEDNPYQRPAMQPLSRGKGNVFLVDRQTRDVIWSTFVLPKTTDSNELNNTADSIVDKLAKDRRKKK